MTSTQAFDDQYGRLNAEQKQAVDTLEGPVFVVAGPGTGKTQVLTLRIANILRTTDTPPDGILALTFTEAAAREMRERLVRIIGPRARQVRIHTFHGFAESIIGRFPDQFPRIIGAQVATDAERAEMLDAALLSASVQHLRPFGDPLFYHTAATYAIATMKRENVTPDALEAHIHESNDSFDAAEGKVHEKGKYAGQMKGEFLKLKKKIEKTEDLLQVYRAYEGALAAARRYDFEDLILEVVRALEADAEFRLQVQEGLLYILADEHQDANRAQNALLELVSGFFERPNLFIVGDEKQAIYRFQGADLDNVQYFRNTFEGTTILTLVENYRSTQSILDSALALIAASPDERLSRVPLIAQSGMPARPISRIACPDAEAEMATLAYNIKNLLQAGTLPADIAVLVRRNRDVAEIARALTRAGLSATGAGDEDALRNRFVRALLRLLRAASDLRDENLAGVLTLPGLPLSAADASRITQHSRRERRTILSILGDADALLAAKVSAPDAASELGATLEELARMASFERPVAVAERALQVSGLLPRMLSATDRAESLAAIRGLLLALEDLSRREHEALLPRALQLLELYEERGMSLPGRGNDDISRVRVMTVHRSKGREFAHVFMPMLTENAWSTRARPEHFYLPNVLSGDNELEDERRLLYVGITRAKEHASISYALTGHDDCAQEPSALLDDLNPELVADEESYASADPVWLSAVSSEASRTEEGAATGPSKDDLATLRTAFFSQGISPTALNNYLECPWKYFYVNLLRIPDAENKFMLFGTAIHATLKRYADQRARGVDEGAAKLLENFRYSLGRMPLSSRELEEMDAKGERALTAWWKGRHDLWPAESRAEVPVEAHISLYNDSGASESKGGSGAGSEQELLLVRGALDRIDTVSGGVNVIDYKTGKPKSRNEIMGATKGADGNYYRQLTFYKLLLARTDEPHTMRDGIIEFVEPDEKGAIRAEAFAITDQEVMELEARIRTCAAEISELTFWNTRCNEAECPWCALRFGTA